MISHPHYYTTHLEWADAFECPVYLAWEDKGWLNRLDRMGKARTFIEGTEEEIEVRGEKTGVLILKPGKKFLEESQKISLLILECYEISRRGILILSSLLESSPIEQFQTDSTA